MLSENEVIQVMQQLGDIHLAYGKPVPTPRVLNMLVDDIAPFGFPVVMDGLAQLRVSYTGQQLITSALLIGFCESACGRLSPDEAWCVALAARNEAATVVWNDEIEQAWWGAAELMRGARPDQVGARRAFIETYTRICHGKRGRGELPEVCISVGTDKQLHIEAIKKAHSRGVDVQGLLQGEQGAAARLALESVGSGGALLLGRDLERAADDGTQGAAARRHLRAELGELQQLLDLAEQDVPDAAASDWQILARNLQQVRERLGGMVRGASTVARPQLTGPEMLARLRDAMAAAPQAREQRRQEQLQAERDELARRKRDASEAVLARLKLEASNKQRTEAQKHKRA